MDRGGIRRVESYFARIGEVLGNAKRRSSFAVYASRASSFTTDSGITLRSSLRMSDDLPRAIVSSRIVTESCRNSGSVLFRGSRSLAKSRRAR